MLTLTIRRALQRRSAWTCPSSAGLARSSFDMAEANLLGVRL